MFKSLMWKVVYGIAAALALALTTNLQTNTDPQLWSIKSLVVVAVPVLVSAIKKIVANAITS